MSEINLNEWRRSNPEKSSPRGRSGWLFDIVINSDRIETKCFCGTYGEAKKAALRYGREMKARDIILLP